jgi:alkylhydroperoxidase/carboxymuconolactone decarboxylase family protein YurZ
MTKVRVRFFVLLALLAVPAISYGQEAASPWLSEAERARFETLRVAGSEALFNLDYDAARKSFKEMAVAFPSYPAGPQFLADTLWAETLYQTRRMQSSLYGSDDTFYSTSDDKVDPKVVDEFRTLTRQARQLTEARLKQFPKEVEALYFMGAIEGLKAAFEEAVERRHFAALKDGSDAVDKHREVIKLDPSYRDAEITIGLYDYTVGALPLPVKIAAGMFGFRGSKKRGLATLERVAKEGNWVHDEAKTLLIVLYTREKRFGEAAGYAKELAAKYPRNYLYRLETADALVSQAAMEREANKSTAITPTESEAFATFESLLKDKAVRDTAVRFLDLIHFKYGEALMTAGQFDRATREFLASASAPGAQQGMATMAHLYAAKALDLAGKRNDALVQYRAVLARPNVYDAHDQAQSGLKEAYKRKLT